MKSWFISLFLIAIAGAAIIRADEAGAARWAFRWAAPPVVGETAELVITAELAPHWIVYSSDFQAEIGPQPTTVDFKGSQGIELVGPVRSVAAQRKRDKTWDIELGYFSTRAEFRQRVKIVKPDFAVRGSVAGQLCDEREGTCTLFTQAIEVSAGK